MTDEIDRELDNLSDEEREALEGEDIGSLTDAEQAAKTAESIGDDGATPDTDDEAAAAADDTPDQTPDPILPQLDAPDLEGHQEQMAALLDQRKSIREQYRNGDISAEEKDRLEDTVNDQIADLRAQQQNAAFVDNWNRKAVETEYVSTIKRVRAEIRETDGIDYDTNKLLERDWDVRVKALASDPANANRPSEWFLREAHRQVKAELEATAQKLGFVRPANAKPDPIASAVRDRRQPVERMAKSLAALPAAAADNLSQGGEFAHLDRLNGDDLEAAIARMSPDQQDRYARA